MRMEGMIAGSPGHRALFQPVLGARLALDAQVHDVITANGTIVDLDVYKEGDDVNDSRECTYPRTTWPRHSIF